MLTQDTTGSTLRHAKMLTDFIDAGAITGGAQFHFFSNASNASILMDMHRRSSENILRLQGLIFRRAAQKIHYHRTNFTNPEVARSNLE